MTNQTIAGIDSDRLAVFTTREARRYAASRPRSLAALEVGVVKIAVLGRKGVF